MWDKTERQNLHAAKIPTRKKVGLLKFTLTFLNDGGVVPEEMLELAFLLSYQNVNG